jgi:hypothetical protein
MPERDGKPIAAGPRLEAGRKGMRVFTQPAACFHNQNAIVRILVKVRTA